MSLPHKSWDANSRVLRATNASGPVPQSSSPSIPAVSRIQGGSAVPPPLPPRQHVNTTSVYGAGYAPANSYSMYGGYGGGYGGYGGGFNGLGGYGLSNFGYNSSYGMPFRGGYNGRSLDDPESRFIQMAAESSRPAFQSIESLVRTFASVTMMLESTFHAMQTSFHAVLGVAENFDRLRQLSVQIAKYVSAITMLRAIYWFYRRILYMLGLIKTHPSSEDVWSAAEKAVVGPSQKAIVEQPTNTIKSAWPVVTFFGLLFGGPFVVYKLISSIKGSDKKEDQWDPRVHESEDVFMLYKFRAASEKELSAEAGERLKIPTLKHIQNNSGWITAVNQNNRIGLVPCNHLGRINKRQPSARIPEIVPSTSFFEGNRNFVSANRTNNEENQGCESNTNSNSDVSPVVISIDKPSLVADLPQKKTEEK